MSEDKKTSITATGPMILPDGDSKKLNWQQDNSKKAHNARKKLIDRLFWRNTIMTNEEKLDKIIRTYSYKMCDICRGEHTVSDRDKFIYNQLRKEILRDLAHYEEIKRGE